MDSGRLNLHVYGRFISRSYLIDAPSAVSIKAELGGGYLIQNITIALKGIRKEGAPLVAPIRVPGLYMETSP